MWGWKPWHQQWVEGFLPLAVRDRITAVLLLKLHLRGQSTCIPIVVLFMLALRKRVLQNEQTHVFVPRFAAPGQMHRIDFKQHWSHRSAFDHTLTSNNMLSFFSTCFLFNMFPVPGNCVCMGRVPGSDRPRPLHREARILGQDFPWKHAWKSVPEQDKFKVLRVILVQENFKSFIPAKLQGRAPYNNLKLWSLCSAFMSTNVIGCPVLSRASRRSKFFFFVEHVRALV